MKGLKWAYEVFGEAQLGDSRRTDRLVKMVSLMADSTECSLSKAMGNPSENKAAQRFCENDAFDYRDIVESIVDSTISKFSETNRVLLIQDTSHLNYDNHKATFGLGHIGSTTDRSFQGIMMHWTMALTGKAEPLGIATLKFWERKRNPRKKIKNAHQNRPIDKKESYKWIESVESLQEQIPTGVQAIWISDRESDIYDFIDTIIKDKQDFVIRANCNRVIAEEEELLKERAVSGKLLGHQEIEIVDQKRSRKRIKSEIRSCEITLVAQRRKGGAKTSSKCSNRKVNVVRVYSKNAKHNIEWILLTTLDVSTLESCLEVIWLYKQRWHIESVHKALKTGFQAEHVRLDSSEKLEKIVAMMLPCAVRIYWMAHKQNYEPDKPASDILTPMELRVLLTKHRKPRNYMPTIKEAWLWIGWMGGFRGSKNSPPPGQITFWRGLSELQSMAAGAQIALAWN